MRTQPDLRDLRGYAELSLLWKAISLLRLRKSLDWKIGASS